jgi:hypothetical protein
MEITWTSFLDSLFQSTIFICDVEMDDEDDTAVPCNQVSAEDITMRCESSGWIAYEEANKTLYLDSGATKLLALGAVGLVASALMLT